MRPPSLAPARWRGVHRGGPPGAGVHPAARGGHRAVGLHRARHPPGGQPQAALCCEAGLLGHQGGGLIAAVSVGVVPCYSALLADSMGPRAPGGPGCERNIAASSAVHAGAYGDDECAGHPAGRAGEAPLGGHLAHRHPFSAQPVPVSRESAAREARQGWGRRLKRAHADAGAVASPQPTAWAACFCVKGALTKAWLAYKTRCPRPRPVQKAAVPPGAGAAQPAAHEPRGPADPH